MRLVERFDRQIAFWKNEQASNTDIFHIPSKKSTTKKAFGASWRMPNTLLDQSADMEELTRVGQSSGAQLPQHLKQRWTRHIQHATTNKNGALYFSYAEIQK